MNLLTSPRANRPVVLVHGAWHGAWCWHRVVAGLEELGIDVRALDLPFVDGTEADIAVLRAELEGLDDAVVCGHSYGGVVVTSACSDSSSVAHLVYLCAFQLRADETTGTFLGRYPTELSSALEFTTDRYSVADDRVADLLYADCPTDDVELARRSLRPMPIGAPEARPVRPAWLDISSTYVICEQDRALHPKAQGAMAERAGRVLSWPTSHSPFFSAPERVVSLLAGLSRGGDGDRISASADLRLPVRTD
jgi:pimeloyl-ACP methyl ester carboxylesterase